MFRSTGGNKYPFGFYTKGVIYCRRRPRRQATDIAAAKDKSRVFRIVPLLAERRPAQP
jgi:hypothetical protein